MSSHTGNPRSECLPFIPSTAETVLDVGCSDGYFGELAQRERGLVVDGVEPDPVTAADAQGRMHHVYEGFFPDVVPADARYDCVTFLDCLEHLVDPWEALRQAAAHLTPDGVVVASLPNIRHFTGIKTIVLKGEWPWEEAGLFDRTHLRFFTRTSMLRLFEEAGFDVISCSPINVANHLKARVLGRVLGADIQALQFVVVGRPVSTASKASAPHVASSPRK